ncbi:hypothetical protein ACFE04_003412 [Oxalis oulophora]
MGSSSLMVVAFGVGVIAMLAFSGSIEAITCIGVKQDLSPCLAFLTGKGPADKPDKACCAGVQDINKYATDTASRRSICDCLISTGISYSINFTRAGQLPQLCGISLPFPIDPKHSVSSEEQMRQNPNKDDRQDSDL